MVIQYTSDLHLEFSVNKKYLDRHFLKPAGQILLLAGDVIPFSKIKKAKPFLQRLSDMYEQVYWIPGNHEYYQGGIPEAYSPANSFEEKIFSNVTLLNNRVVELEKARIILSTFWSHIPVSAEWALQKGMADFSLITENGKPISCAQYDYWHNVAIDFVKRESAATSPKKTIVVTHHVPTFHHYPKEFVDSQINNGFATEYFDFIESSNIDYWIFGHHHRNIAAFPIGKTQMLTNQLGYVWYQEEEGFDENRTITID